MYSSEHSSSRVSVCQINQNTSYPVSRIRRYNFRSRSITAAKKSNSSGKSTDDVGVVESADKACSDPPILAKKSGLIQHTAIVAGINFTRLIFNPAANRHAAALGTTGVSRSTTVARNPSFCTRRSQSGGKLNLSVSNSKRCGNLSLMILPILYTGQLHSTCAIEKIAAAGNGEKINPAAISISEPLGITSNWLSRHRMA